MVRRNALLGLVLAGVVGALWIGQAICQERARGGRRDPEEMRRRIEEFRKAAAERLRESLGVDEKEWEVLKPRIEKVQTLSRQLRWGMRDPARRFGRRGMRQGGEAGTRRERRGGPGARDREQTAVGKAADALRKILENKEAKPAEIKAGLDALRQAKEKLSDELAKARKALREVVTMRQEAQLVLRRLLD